ncbi:MAG: hypothetical protein ACYDEQ_03720 [Desulfocucumaceae bacterium]
MKKRLGLLLAAGILVVALAAPAAFGAIAGNGQGAQNQQFYNQMFDWHQKWLDQAQKDGQITPEQAKTWQEHFNYMRDFHNKNGFGPMGSMMGGNGMMGSGNGMMGNFNNGFGGMMNWGNNNNNSTE